MSAFWTKNRPGARRSALRLFRHRAAPKYWRVSQGGRHKAGGHFGYARGIAESPEGEKAQLANAEQVAKAAAARHPQLQPQIVHGTTPAAEKNAALENFRTGKTALLVATTVVEVGVDVLDADVMVIENAGRMGLSQLHQLRGRVGRGGKNGYCVLLYDEQLSAAAKARLKILHDSDDGICHCAARFWNCAGLANGWVCVKAECRFSKPRALLNRPILCARRDLPPIRC